MPRGVGVMLGNLPTVLVIATVDLLDGHAGAVDGFTIDSEIRLGDFIAPAVEFLDELVVAFAVERFFALMVEIDFRQHFAVNVGFPFKAMNAVGAPVDRLVAGIEKGLACDVAKRIVGVAGQVLAICQIVGAGVGGIEHAHLRLLAF